MSLLLVGMSGCHLCSINFFDCQGSFEPLKLKGDFDAAIRLVSDAGADLGTYLVNSLNPFRLEGQKSIIREILAQRGWRVPKWIIVPGGN